MTQFPPQRPGRHHMPGDAPAPTPAWNSPSSSPPAWNSPSAAQQGWNSPSAAQQGWAAQPSWSASQQPMHPTAEPAGLPAAVRGRALDRAIQVNASHARNAADRVGTRDALGEHALMLFSVDQTARPFRLSTATRLDYEEHTGEDLPALLQALTSHAWSQIQSAVRAGRRWDPRTPMEGLVLRSDEVTPDTEYIGLGISTLDTPTATWHDTKRTVSSADGLNLAGQGYVMLKDGTAMYFLRAAQVGGNSGQHSIVTSRTVHSIYRPRLEHELVAHAPEREATIWQGLEKLHHVLMSA